MARQNNRHRRSLEKIATHPEKFGFKNIISVSIEKRLFHKGKIYAEPDLIFEMKKGEVHIVEYKGLGNGELLDRVRKQLENAKWWYGRYRTDIEPENIYTRIISGDDPKYKTLLR